jgi:pimeloyl-ACP methyl ester carboxylesterase
VDRRLAASWAYKMITDMSPGEIEHDRRHVERKGIYRRELIFKTGVAGFFGATVRSIIGRRLHSNSVDLKSSLNALTALAPKMSPPGSKRIAVRDNVDLHFLDWGGNKQPLLLLAGLGDTAYIFTEFARQLTDNFHVIAMTRRGYGESDVTQDGYSISDRAEDIRGAMDALKLPQVVFVGHAAAGDELTAFAIKYPQRIRALVYLDAAYDRGDPKTPQPHIDVWRKVADKLYGGMSEDDSCCSLSARRRALSNLFKAEYGVDWNEALEDNLRETSVVNVDGTLSDRTPSFVGQAIRESNRAERLNVAAVRVPALLIFARGPLPESINLQSDERAAVRKDEQEYGEYFQK